ncbi:PQQ-binding-like beta-propeller repeat protein [Candidatus Woesearchaeota archaeon]|nr:PQQ-binding-like beta-propeller repeat protein [Candidatus Woesearchaeota archaeon]
MKKENYELLLEELRQLLVDRGVKLNEGFNSDGSECRWLVDCREVMLIPRGSYLVSELIREKFKKFKSKTVGGLTLAANPLVSFIVLKKYEENDPVSGFIIRKKPKYNGLRKLIEGDFKPGESVVILDDLVNSGGSVFNAISIVEEAGCKVEGVLTIVNFGNKGLRELKEKGYKVEYLYDLEDLFIRNKDKKSVSVKPKVDWKINKVNNWEVSVPRSSPVMYKDSLLFGTNEGKFLSVNKKTGKTNWSIKLEIKNNPKKILSSPTVKGNKVFFGAYDGYLYCVNADNGSIIWKTRTGEWIGSSPCVYDGKVFVGIEYGLRGGSLCAYSLEDGKLLWYLRTRHYLHSSPAIDKKNGMVVVGCNDGFVYAADCKTGKQLWKYGVGKETKAGFVMDSGKVYFGSFDGNIHCLDIKDGKPIWKRRVGNLVYSTPEIVEDSIISSTVSKRIISLNKKTGSINWYYNTIGEIFSYTNTLDKNIYCGDDNGYFYVLNSETGNLIKKYGIGKSILTKPLIEGKKAYLGCKGKFVCIRL